MPAARLNDDRCYRALDRLLPHEAALEQHLVPRLGQLFAVDYDLLLYDVTSTYFEGLAPRNALAQRGHSRDHRHHCLQVCLALMVTRDGVPLGYELFPRNRVDLTSVQEIVATMDGRYGAAQRVWVMDRGMASAANVAWLQRTGRQDLIGTAKQSLRRFSREVATQTDWQTVRDGIEAKLCAGPDGPERFLLRRSADRREKERAMHARFATGIEAGLTQLRDRLARAQAPQARGPVERQIGRLLAENRRAAGRYAVTVIDAPACPAGIAVTGTVQAAWDTWAEHTEGVYIMRPRT